MVMVNISEAKTQLSALLDDVLKGQQVIISKAGKPIAVLSKYNGASGARTPGVLRGQIRIADDFDVLPDDIAGAFGMTDE